jgi:hypothetical protein
MGSAVNPLLLTGNNPTGANMGNPQVMMDLFQPKGSNPLIPTIGTSGSKPSTTQNNPFSMATTSGGAVPGSPMAMDTLAAPNFPANASPYPTSGGGLLPGGGTNATGAPATDPFGLSKMTHKDLSRMFDGLKKTYGDGMAHMLMDFLTSGAGYNQGAINNLLASLQPGIKRGEADIMEQFSAMGTRFGSPAAVGLGDYLSQVNLNEGQLVTQMYEQSLQDFINVMMGTAGQTSKRIGSSPGLFDQIGSIMGLVEGGAAGAGAGLAASAGGAGTIASILAGLAAI